VAGNFTGSSSKPHPLFIPPLHTYGEGVTLKGIHPEGEIGGEVRF